MLLILLLCVTSSYLVWSLPGFQLPPDFANMSDRELIVQLMHRMNHLEDDNRNQHARMEQIEGNNRRLEEENKRMQANMEQMETTIRHRAKLIAELEERLKDKSGKLKEATGDHIDNRQLDSRVHSDSSVRNIRQLSQQNGSRVAFSVYVSNNLDHLGTHQNLIFDAVDLDTMHAYHRTHGVYTVPVSGMYLITSTVLASQNREVYCEIMVNGEEKANIYARGTDNRHDQGSNTIILHLNQGDDVSVQNFAADDSVFGYKYTTFAGFLLFEDAVN